MLIKCPCGTQGNVKLQGLSTNQPSGWLPVPGFDGAILYLCPKCATKAKEHAKALIDLCGTDNIYVPALK